MGDNSTEYYGNTTMKHTTCLVLQVKGFVPWNNSDNIVSFYTEDALFKLRILFFLPVTFLLGVPANVINMMVFYKQGLKERINVCLFALSLSDGLYLLVNMVARGEIFYFHFTTGAKYGPVLKWFVNHNFAGLYGFSWVSQVLTAIVASERCYCILQPLKSQNILHTWTMTAIIVVTYTVVLGLRFLAAARYYIDCGYDPVSDRTFLTATASKFYIKHKKMVDFLDVFMYGVGLPWVVVVVVVVTTVVTVIKLRQVAEWRAGITSSTSNVSLRDIALTRMLVGNSIFFICCVFPVGLFRLSLLFLPEMNTGRRHHNMFSSVLWVTHILTYINSSFNIVVYFTMGSRYRQTVRTLLCSEAAKNTPSKVSVTT